MNEPTLRRTSTHASDDCSGFVLGIPVALFLWFALALLAGAGLFAWQYFSRGADFLTALEWAALFPGLVLLYLRTFHVGRPQGYFADWLETRLFGGHASPRTQPPPQPWHDL